MAFSLEMLRSSIVLSPTIPKPAIAEFYNRDEAVALFVRHLSAGATVAVHFDIDCDGFAAGVVAYRALQGLSARPLLSVNSVRVHGVTDETASFCAANAVDLLVVVDAGSALDYDVCCDVIVLDHHECAPPGIRVINGHTQIVVNNTYARYVEPMSGCGVCYEFFRYLYKRYRREPIDSRLAQWVGVSLISDVIDTKTPRNQYYIRQAFEGSERRQPDLLRVSSDADAYFKRVSKAQVTFKLAPTINGMARAGLSAELAYVISDQEPLQLPVDAIERRNAVCTAAVSRAKTYKAVQVSDISDVPNSENYTGLAASKILGLTGKSSVVCIKRDGRYSGSFRGAGNTIEYLSVAKKHIETAAGHMAAFGFQSANKAAFLAFLSEISELQTTEGGEVIVPDSILTDADIFDIALWNSRVSGSDDVYIAVDAKDLAYEGNRGKVLNFRWRGAECKAFAPVSSPVARLHVSANNGLEIFVY